MASGTPTMRAKDMLKYYGILLQDRNDAIEAQDMVKANALTIDIENARVMLRSSFYATVEESIKEQTVNLGLFNRPALQLAMGKQIELPTNASAQMELNLQEEATDTAFAEVEQTPTVVITNPENLKTYLEEILKGQFTSYVPNAISEYNKQTGQSLSPGKAWLEILKIVNPIKGYDAWHDYLIDTVYNQTPLHAMLYLGRLWRNVKPYDIADFLETVCLDCASSEFDAIIAGSKFDITLHHDLVHGYRKYPELRKIASKICDSEEDLVIDGIISRFTAAIPHPNRNNMRKKYVEKGY